MSGLAGCSSSSDTATADAALCASIEGLEAQLATLRTMLTAGAATAEQVGDQVDQVRNSVDGLAEAGQQVTASAVADLQAAQATFDKAVEAIPASATVGEATNAHQAALADYEASVEATRDEVGCEVG